MSHTSGRVIVVAAAMVMAVAAAAPVHARRTITLRVPRFDVAPHTDREVCTFVPLPSKKPFDVAGSLIVNVGIKGAFTTHHFLLWVYEGKDLASFPPQGQLVDSKACLDFGPTDTNQRALIAGSQSPTLRTQLHRGLAQQIKPTVNASGESRIGLILNSHWINGTDSTQPAAVKVKLFGAKRHTVRQYLLPLFDVIANGFIKVPPHQVKMESWTWHPKGLDIGNMGSGLGGGVIPSGSACVVGITSHMHKRGKLFTVDFMQGSTATKRLLETTTYSDPPQVSFPEPMLVTATDGLKYTCTHDNGSADPSTVKLGCAEVDHPVPGVDAATTFLQGKGAYGAAKRCSAVGPDPTECPPTDPAYPGRTFTGKCVEANLVFGFTSDDDMCILPGAFYPANAQGSCDLTGLPILN